MLKQLKDYKIIKLIGKGSFGEVYKVSKDNKYYALKISIPPFGSADPSRPGL